MAKRSPLELADMVTDETSIEAKIAGGVADDNDLAVAAAERALKIELIVKEHQVPKPIAEIIADTGYSKGTANRIYNDTQKRMRIAREAAQASKSAGGKAAKAAEATA